MITPTPTDIDEIKNAAVAELESVTSVSELEKWRVHYLGRKGLIPQILRQVKDAPANSRAALGKKGNEIRQTLTAAFTNKQKTFNNQPDSIPSVAAPAAVGHLHPLSLSIRQLYTVLTSLGFQPFEGPLVEEAKFNFDYLNIPLEHPARAESDTFYLENPDLVLRTHTSPVQVRAVLEKDLTPPFRICSPGRVFRSENTDASHDSTFYQFEGLEIGSDITVAHLKGAIAAIYSQFFGKKVSTRLRISYFPFVEPGFEVDISCFFCQQKGCRVCQHSGWIEVMGAGIVHPNVLRSMNIDPTKYQGYAFGGAIDRIAMLRHGINDIRLLWTGDFEFLRQFSSLPSV
jgi:phenylalanyl-tRNA synthetase alpha chain